MFENFVVFRKSPQNLRFVFKQISESPQISAILRKTCEKHRNTEKQLKNNARKISQADKIACPFVRMVRPDTTSNATYLETIRGTGLSDPLVL